MRTGKIGPWRLRPAGPAWCRLGVALCLLAGCAHDHPHVDQAMKTESGGQARNEGVAEQYLIHCPDVLSVQFDGRPDLGGQAAVAADGRVNLEKLGRPRVEGRAASEVARGLATALDMPAGGVHVRVAEYRSQQIYLVGEVIGLQRAVPYQGPETVLDLLQRVGGITPGAAPEDVHIIRSHVADGHDPEVFHVDLQNIVMHKDQKTNVRLQPFDQVNVGQTRRAVLERCLPPWLLSLAGHHEPAGNQADLPRP
jgi:protein involved in polysaccharide export with SLBB domain